VAIACETIGAMLSRPPDDSWAAWFSDLHYGARLRDIDLTSADLISVHTPRLAWFTRCLFVGADLRQSTLDGVAFLRCDFSRADLRGPRCAAPGSSVATSHRPTFVVLTSAARSSAPPARRAARRRRS